MTAANAEYKYSRRTVFGSNAYDLARQGVAYAPQPEETVEAQPVENTRARAVAVPAPSRLPAAMAVILAAAAAALVVFVLLSCACYTDVTYDNMQLQERLSLLQDESSKLTAEYENAFDINEVETYATSVLGMVVPSAGQVGTIETGAYDKAVILNDGSGDEQGDGGLFTFMASLAEYF